MRSFRTLICDLRHNRALAEHRVPVPGRLGTPLRSRIARCALLCALCLSLLAGGTSARAGEGGAPALPEGVTAETVALGEDVTLTFLKSAEGFLLGLQKAEVDGVALKAPSTLWRPLLLQDFGESPKVMQLFKLKEIKKLDGGGVALHAEVYANEGEAAQRSIFVFTGDIPKAAANLTDELKAMKKKADAAIAAIDKAVESDPEVVALIEKTAKEKKELAELKKSKEAGDKRKARNLGRALGRRSRDLKKLREARREALTAKGGAQADQQALINAYQAALGEYALKSHGKIHRDYYKHPHLRMAAEVSTVASVAETVATFQGEAKPVGSIVWTFTPERAGVAGWPWVGFAQSLAFDLQEGLRLNAIRFLGSWELGGSVDGLTLVSHRYRGLGPIEQTLTADKDGGSEQAWTTTEILPGAVGGKILISPIVPESVAVNDRGYALKHRAGAWITRMARGAGSSFIDYQYLPDGALTRFHPRQGALRAMTEVYQGDPVVGQVDEEYFALRSQGETTPMITLALKPPAKQPVHESRTRYLEVREYARELVEKALNFVHFEAEPSVGYNFDYAWEKRTQRAVDSMDKMAESGVRMMLVHHPGWLNARGMNEVKHPDKDKLVGGDCVIWDYRSMDYALEPWKALQRKAAKYNMSYYVWIGSYGVPEGPLVGDMGRKKEHFLNPHPLPEDATYEDLLKPGKQLRFNIRNDHVRKVYTDRMLEAAKTIGFQGFWNDSFQSNNMSRFAWPDGSGTTLQAEWWEWIAEWTRRGVGFMSESHAFPGLTCSVEVVDWEEDVWSFPNTVKWLRGRAQADYTPEALNELCFRIHAVKGGLAPELAGKLVLPQEVIPDFPSIAHRYNAVRPMMRRLYHLPAMTGTLWLGYAGNGEGVWFTFAKGKVPEGVTATLLDDHGKPGETVAEVAPWQILRVKAEGEADLRAAFGMQIAPESDERIGRTYTEPTYMRPDPEAIAPAPAEAEAKGDK